MDLEPPRAEPIYLNLAGSQKSLRKGFDSELLLFWTGSLKVKGHMIVHPQKKKWLCTAKCFVLTFSNTLKALKRKSVLCERSGFIS